MKKVKWYVYIIENSRGFLYTGITTDLERRFKEHGHDKKKGAKFFRTGSALQVVFTQVCSNRSEASRLEAAIKKLSRIKKVEMIKQGRF